MNAEPSLLPDLLRSLAALAFTLGLIITAAWTYRRYGTTITLPTNKTARLNVLEKRTLNATTTLYLVQHDTHEHLLAVTGTQITLLHTNPTQLKKKK